MLSPEVYGLLLAAAVLAIVVCILALERLRIKVKQHTSRTLKVCPAEPAGIETDSQKKGGSQGI